MKATLTVDNCNKRVDTRLLHFDPIEHMNLYIPCIPNTRRLLNARVHGQKELHFAVLRIHVRSVMALHMYSMSALRNLKLHDS